MKIHLHIPTTHDMIKLGQALDRLMLQHPDLLAHHEYICHHTTGGPQVTAKLGGRASDGQAEHLLDLLHQELFGAPAAPTAQPAAQTNSDRRRILAASFLRSMAVHVGLVTEASADYALQLATDLREIGAVSAAYYMTHITNNRGRTLNSTLQKSCKRAADQLDPYVQLVGQITPAPKTRLPLRIEIANLLEKLIDPVATPDPSADHLQTALREMIEQAKAAGLNAAADFLGTAPGGLSLTGTGAGAIKSRWRTIIRGFAQDLRAHQRAADQATLEASVAAVTQTRAAEQAKALKVDGWELERRRRDAAVIAGLRLLQAHLSSAGTPGPIMGVILTDNGSFDPLSVKEIDDLIKSTNE